MAANPPADPQAPLTAVRRRVQAETKKKVRFSQ